MVYRRNRKMPVKKAPVRKMVKKVMKKKYTVSPLVKSYVKKALSTAIENKFPTPVSGQDVSLQSIVGGASSNWGSLIRLSDVWTISQGTGEGNRVGNKITPMKWYIRGFIHNNSGTSVPSIVKMFIFKQKNTYVSPDASSTTGPVDFYQYGSTSIQPANNMQDILREVNKDRYQLFTTRTFKVGSAGSGTNLNNDFKTVCPFRVDLMKYQKHRLTYDDAITNIPTNSGLFVCFAIANYDGTTGTYTVGAPQISYDVIAEFEDA